MHGIVLATAEGEKDGSVVELRREAVTAVVRQQRLREELARVRARAAWIERRAFRAVERGEEMLARQVIARGICTLKTRDALEEQSVEARRRLALVLTALVCAENRAWGLPDPCVPRRSRPNAAAKRGWARSGSQSGSPAT